MSNDDAPGALTSRLHIRALSDLIAAGTTSRDVYGDVSRGALVRMRRGVFTETAAWNDAFPEERMRAEALALATSSRGAPIVFARQNAGAYWNLPLFRTRADRVHVVQTQTSAPSSRHVFRHRDRLADDDIHWIVDGRIGVTSLERTAFDLACALPWESAQAMMDAALRAASLIPGTRDLDAEAADRMRDAIGTRIARATGRRGIRQARLVLEFADPRADLPGESVSRLYLSWLGFPRPELQVPVPGPYGHDYAVDFGFPTWWGEFDGETKYTDPRYLNGRTLEEVLLREKEREDWIRATTERPFARWRMAHIPSALALGRRLASFQIYPPG